jgi:uncharacterized membrane protein YhaH (DUF805 family)
MSNYLNPWKKYASFSGRATRAEYWTFTLVNVVIYGALYYGSISAGIDVLMYVALGFALVMFLPSLAVLVRRLHDTGRSGAWFFISLVPILGSLWLLVLTLLGSQGPNKFGEAPALAAA